MIKVPNFAKISNYIKKKGLFSAITKGIGNVVYKFVSPALLANCKKRTIKSNAIVFVSSPDYADNSKELYDFLISKDRYKGFNYIWLVENSKEYCANNNTMFIEKKSKWHLGYSIKALEALSESKYIFFTHSSPMAELGIKKEQVVINLWHGCGYKQRKSTYSWIEKNPFTYALVPGKIFVRTKSEFWTCNPEQILTIGYPRYDAFNKLDDNTRDFFEEIKGNADTVIMWMPTYRKTENDEFGVSKIKGFFELPLLTSNEDLLELDRYCATNNIIICIKRHPLQIKYACEKLSCTNILFIDNEKLTEKSVNLYSLLSCLDGLVTDYSSIAIDYLLLDKPMAFTLDDFQEYEDVQGFVFEDPLRYMPGHHLYDYNGLLEYLQDMNHGKDQFKDARRDIICETHNPCDNYCERIADTIIGK